MYICIYVNICINVYMYVCICVYVYMYICIYLYIYICIYVYMYICIYVYMYICIYVIMSLCHYLIYVYMYVYIYICIYIYIHTYIHRDHDLAIEIILARVALGRVATPARRPFFSDHAGHASRNQPPHESSRLGVMFHWGCIEKNLTGACAAPKELGASRIWKATHILEGHILHEQLVRGHTGGFLIQLVPVL